MSAQPLMCAAALTNSCPDGARCACAHPSNVTAAKAEQASKPGMLLICQNFLRGSCPGCPRLHVRLAARPWPPAPLAPLAPAAPTAPTFIKTKICTKALAPIESLHPYLGSLLTEAELKEVKRYSEVRLPLSALPRVAILANDSQESPAPPAITYRSSVYGPYDHLALSPDQHPRGFRYALHLGQTKLAFSEIEAITRALERVPNLRYVVYAGAASGEHLAFIAELFPGLEIHGYDPAPFGVQRRYGDFPGVESRIHLMNVYFTDSIAAGWKNRGAQTIFISDIRSGSQEDDDFEETIWVNMQMQRRWWELMAPAAALFKFREPYTDGLVDSKCEYLDGELLLQPFGPNTSTEGRLLIWAGAGVRTYSSICYESYYAWLNTVIREWASFDHGLPLDSVPGLCRCFDCARAVQILREAVIQGGTDPVRAGGATQDEKIARLFGRLRDATRQNLLKVAHGTRAEELMAVKRADLAERFESAFIKGKQTRFENLRNRNPTPTLEAAPRAAPRPQAGRKPQAAEPRR